MDMKTKHAPFSLYKKKTGARTFWYVRYWNPQERAYTVTRATGVEAAGRKGRKSEAELAAAKMLPEIFFSAANRPVTDYLSGFWDRESPYFKELRTVQNREVSGFYIKASRDIIRLHVAPYPPFSATGMGNLTAGMIRDYMLWLAERGVPGARINRALQVIRVPLRYAVSRGEAKEDPFTKIKAAAAGRKEKGVLTRREAAALVISPVRSLRERLAVLLGLLCGLRQGEARGLCWEDIGDGEISVRHNFQDLDGLKGPKCGSFRKVPIVPPLDGVIAAYRKECGGPESGLVFSRDKDEKPLCPGFFRLAKERELAAIGIPGTWTSAKKKPEGYVNEQAARNITFHSLRHTFVSLARLAGVNDFEAQALVGHKSAQMMNLYSHGTQVVETGSCGERIKTLFENGGAL
jgi:integrase